MPQGYTGTTEWKLSEVRSEAGTTEPPFKLGFRVKGLGFTGSRVWGSGLRVRGSGFRVWGSGFRVKG